MQSAAADEHAVCGDHAVRLSPLNGMILQWRSCSPVVTAERYDSAVEIMQSGCHGSTV